MVLLNWNYGEVQKEGSKLLSYGAFCFYGLSLKQVKVKA